jgi:CRISPR-associated endonuclease/helicase Cas3
MTEFDRFFQRITKNLPYEYQKQVAELPAKDCLIRVPTGCGKTAAVIGAWMWRIQEHRAQIPTRLVYCLPMRVLVEQTRTLAEEWAPRSETGVQVYSLMGSEIDKDWEFDPGKPAIFVGTQDQLLSRALNRGYAMSRYRWPVHFGLLNNDCLWVCDEVQLMGNGLGTTAQLQAFRQKWGTYGPVATWWMSATADREWLKTVDYGDTAGIELVELGKTDRDGKLRSVYTAAKPIERLDTLDRAKVELLHRAGTLTLVVRNTVARARELYDSLRLARRGKKTADVGELSPETVLIHGRFRPPDRERSVRKLLVADRLLRGEAADCQGLDPKWLDRVKETGLIAVTTQVVEAGVDLSAETLITEIAPWPSMVQRLGRCNRGGKQDGRAKVRWVPLPDKEAAPYEVGQLKEARIKLEQLTDGSIANLEQFQPFAGQKPTHVIRQHDLHGLFSTEPDLAGGFTDISAYVRDAERDMSVYVFWREKPGKDEASPMRDEICSVPLNKELMEFLKTHKASEWNGETERWEHRRPSDVRPGMTLLLDRRDGGYSDELGWTGNKDDLPTINSRPENEADAVNRDAWSATEWDLLTAHLRDAQVEAKALVSHGAVAESGEAGAVVLGALWHDVGKNHPKWQGALPTNGRPGVGPWAKFRLPAGERFRPDLRHEAASALYCFNQWRAGAEGWTALAVYLVAAHHGKVRTVLRSRKAGGSEDVFGILEGDKLPTLGGWMNAEYTLNAACRVFGASGDWSDDEEAFELVSPSWVGMVAELLGPEAKDDVAPDDAVAESEPRHLGPFRLAYLEALIVAADVRASRKPGAGGVA